MNRSVKTIFGSNILNTLRKTLAYVLIFSLLWQNVLWASGPLVLIEEELPASQSRLYGSHRIGIVEPGSVREDGVHNVFEDLQLSDEGGLVFTGHTEGSPIYNRVYNDESINLAGTIAAKSRAPVVFGNCGGIQLENPDFRNIQDLTLTAGHLALTNKGMAYDVGEGDISINHTVIAEDSDLTNLSLAGRDIQIIHSLLNPTDQIKITSGSHIGVLGPQGGISVSPDEQDEDSVDSPISIYTDESSILRSKGIMFQSLENGSTIYSHGMLESTDEDIIIRARGDIYLNQLVANRNLIIKTTGNVYFGDNAYVGGSVHVSAQKIYVEQELSSVGRLYLKASKHLSVNGALTSHDEVSLKGEESMDLKGFFASKRGVKLESADAQNSGKIETSEALETLGKFHNLAGGSVKAKSLLTPLSILKHNEGNVEVEDSISLDVESETLKGTINTYGRFESNGKNLTVEGRLTAQGGSRLNLGTLTNNGRFTVLGSGLEGTIKKLVNFGKIDFSEVHATIGQTINEKTGVLRTRGGFDLKGDSYQNNGKVFTCGVHRASLKGAYKDEGVFYSPILFLLDAKTVDYATSHRSFLKDVLTNASSDLNVEKGAQFNVRTVDHLGIPDSYLFHLTSKGSLNYHGSMKQSSTERFPLLDFFHTFNESTTRSNGKDPIYFSDFAKEVYSIPLESWISVKKSLTKGLILKASQDINCDGALVQPDNNSVSLTALKKLKVDKSNIIAGYFKGDNMSAKGEIVTLTDSKLISLFGDASIIAREWASLTNTQLKGQKSASLQADSTLMDRSTIKSERGGASVQATKNSAFKNSKVEGSESTHVHSGDAAFQSTTLNSRTGSTSVKTTGPVEFTESNMHGKNTTVESGGNLKSKDSKFKAKNDVGLHGESLDMDESSVRGGNNASVQARNKAKLNHTLVKAPSSASVSGTEVSLHLTQVKSKNGAAFVNAKKSADITDSGVKGKSVIIYAEKRANVTNSQVEGDQKAGVYSQTVDMNDSKVTSANGTATVQGDKKTTLSATSVKGKTETTIRGREVKLASSHVESQDLLAHIYGDKSVDIDQSEIKGKSTLVESNGKLVLSLSRLVGEYNRVTGKTIDAKKFNLEGRIDFIGQDSLKVEDSKADNLVTATAKDIAFSGSNTVGSLNVEGKHISNVGDIEAKDHSRLKGDVIDQLGSTKAGKTSLIEATQKYNDTTTSRNEAGEKLVLLAEETKGFKGQQKADMVIIKLKDMNLLDLLNQTHARVTEAHLKDTEVKLDSDTVIDRTLHLWAKRLENKKNLTVNGDFTAHIQTQILNTGKMLIHGKSAFESDEFDNLSGSVDADDIFVKARRFLSERLVEREYTATGYRDNLKAPAILRARKGDVSVHTTESLKGIGAHFEAKKSVHLRSEGVLHLSAQETSEDITTKSKKSSLHSHTETNHKSTIVAQQGNATTHSGKDTLLHGVDITAGGGLRVKSERALRIINVHDTHETESKKKSKGGVFKRKKTETKQEATETVVRNFFKAGKEIFLESEEDAVVQAPDIESGGKTTIRSNQGKVYMASDKTTHMFHLQKSGKNAFWQSQQDKGRVDEQVLMANIRAKGGVSISGAKGVSVEFNKSLDLLENDPNTAWVKNLRHYPHIGWVKVEEEHKKWNKKGQGLTPAAMALIAIATSLVTGGTGGALLDLATNSIECVMASAGFSTLVSQSIISVANNKGNVGKVLKDLTSKEQLQGFAISVVSAGLTHGLCTQLGISQTATGLSDRLARSTLQTGVSSGFSAVQGEDLGEALLQGAINIAASTAAAYAANQLAAEYKKGDMHTILHKTLHAVLGAGLGAASNIKDPVKGAFGGATAALAEIIAEQLPDTLSQDIRANIAILSAASVALLTKQDVNAAGLAATNAIENNCLQPYPSWEAELSKLENTNAGMEWLTTDIPYLEENKKQLVTAYDSELQSIENALKSLSIPAGNKRYLRELHSEISEQKYALSTLSTCPGGIALDFSDYLTIVGQGRRVVISFVKKGTQTVLKFFPRKIVASEGKSALEALDLATGNTSRNIAERAAHATAPAPKQTPQPLTQGKTQAPTPKPQARTLAQQKGKTSAPKSAISRNQVSEKGPVRISTTKQKALLPNEGKVGSYSELKKLEKPGDNLTPHHMPQDSYMKLKGVEKKEGVSMMVEQPNPGVGGRHRKTRTYGKRPNVNESSRQALGRDIKDMKTIYQEDGLYTPDIRDSLQKVIKENKRRFPHLFEKKQ